MERERDGDGEGGRELKDMIRMADLTFLSWKKGYLKFEGKTRRFWKITPN
jgi:hypothetical protein